MSLFLFLIDGLVNLCKLADINHRINRACEHDTHQVSQWVENEQTRRDGHSSSLEQRRVRLQQLRGDDERGVIQQGVVKLKAEIAVLGKALTAAEREEEEARRVRYLWQRSILSEQVKHFVLSSYYRYTKPRS